MADCTVDQSDRFYLSAAYSPALILSNIRFYRDTPAEK